MTTCGTITAPRLGLASGSSSMSDFWTEAGGADNGDDRLGTGDTGPGDASALKRDWDISKRSDDRFWVFDVLLQALY